MQRKLHRSRNKGRSGILIAGSGSFARLLNYWKRDVNNKTTAPSAIKPLPTVPFDQSFVETNEYIYRERSGGEA